MDAVVKRTAMIDAQIRLGQQKFKKKIKAIKQTKIEIYYFYISTIEITYVVYKYKNNPIL